MLGTSWMLRPCCFSSSFLHTSSSLPLAQKALLGLLVVCNIKLKCCRPLFRAHVVWGSHFHPCHFRNLFYNHLLMPELWYQMSPSDLHTCLPVPAIMLALPSSSHPPSRSPASLPGYFRVRVNGLNPAMGH